MPGLTARIEVGDADLPGVRARIDEAITLGIWDMGKDILASAIKKLIQVAYDTGNLARSGSLQNQRPFGVDIAFTAPYAEYIEHGTGPSADKYRGGPRDRYMPPFQPLFEWVRRKGITMTDRRTGKPMTLEQVTNVIRWAIYKRGIKPRYFFEFGVQHGLDRFEELMLRRLEEV